MLTLRGASGGLGDAVGDDFGLSTCSTRSAVEELKESKKLKNHFRSLSRNRSIDY
jgi:hypothetical protein